MPREAAPHSTVGPLAAQGPEKSAARPLGPRASHGNGWASGAHSDQPGLLPPVPPQPGSQGLAPHPRPRWSQVGRVACPFPRYALGPQVCPQRPPCVPGIWVLETAPPFLMPSPCPASHPAQRGWQNRPCPSPRKTMPSERERDTLYLMAQVRDVRPHSWPLLQPKGPTQSHLQ